MHWRALYSYTRVDGDVYENADANCNEYTDQYTNVDEYADTNEYTNIDVDIVTDTYVNGDFDEYSDVYADD